jgi:uncharacterized protein
MLSRRSFLSAAVAAPVLAADPAELRLLILSGGHAFEESPFLEVFRNMKGVSFTHARFKQDAESKLAPEATNDFDVMLFYDMHQNPEPHWDSWVRLLEKGMPSVFLHHALGSYAKVPAYLDIVGGRAQFTPKVIPGEISTFWKHGEDMRVVIADRQHPITSGLEDFLIHDECYKGFYVRPDAYILLTTDHPLNDQKIAWTYRYKNSPIVYLQLGHDHFAYQNPHFRKLLERSIRWARQQVGCGS